MTPSLQRWIPEGSRQRASPEILPYLAARPLSSRRPCASLGWTAMSGEYGGPDLTRYQAVFDGTVSTNSLDGIWEAFCRRSLGSDGQPLAISDLVELYDDSGSEFYYVDRTAIVPVQLKAPEQESGMTMTL